MTIEFPVMVSCVFCERKFQFGPHRYDGKHISKSQIALCKICLNASWDGVGPTYEAKFLSHLEAKGLPIPEQNSKGFYSLRP